MVALNKKPKKEEHPPDNVSAISVAVKVGSTGQGGHMHVQYIMLAVILHMILAWLHIAPCKTQSNNHTGLISSASWN